MMTRDLGEVRRKYETALKRAPTPGSGGAHNHTAKGRREGQKSYFDNAAKASRF